MLAKHDLPQGSLYPAIHGLENRGLQEAGWQRLIEASGLILKMSEGGA
ncbi:MAG TPA: hypothetical protein VJQ56_13080 [Blastocatellia bacterium]|nr:hypothetical protein [Blastocatellia bacterium]